MGIKKHEVRVINVIKIYCWKKQSFSVRKSPFVMTASRFHSWTRSHFLNIGPPSVHLQLSFCIYPCFCTSLLLSHHSARAPVRHQSCAASRLILPSPIIEGLNYGGRQPPSEEPFIMWTGLEQTEPGWLGLHDVHSVNKTLFGPFLISSTSAFCHIVVWHLLRKYWLNIKHKSNHFVYHRKKLFDTW